MWILAAVCSAVFAGATAILAKCGIKKTDSDVATALRTIVVLVFAWLATFIVGSHKTIALISPKSWLFIILSGLATGASWLCYFKALSMADVNKVAPVDKSSTILSVLLAIAFFRETNNLAIKLVSTALIGTGIFLMIEKRNTENGATDKKWLIFAVLSAVCAALTSVFAKIGLSDTESNLATALRTCVVLIMAWIIVFAQKKQTLLKKTDKKELLFIALSGVTTGLSWLCYYYAVKKGVLSVVIPIDKMSILLTVLFSRIFFKEKLTIKGIVGLCLMCAGTVAMAIWA